MTGVELIAAERKKQVEVNGYDAAHDDTHVDQEMAATAAVVLLRYTGTSPVEDCWGIAEKWRDNPVKLLTIAGALIAAEIDRLQRPTGAKEGEG